MIGKHLALISIALLGASGALRAADAQPTAGLYEQKIKPLLTEKCIACHGPLRRESGLRLDAIQLLRAGGDSGAVVNAEQDGQSELLARVQAVDAELRMPPEGEGTPLTAEQISWLEQWIADDLPGPEHEEFLNGPQDHWAYQPIARPQLPADAQGSTAIDMLLNGLHQQRGLVATPPAAEEVWLRRVYLDLIGLPPSLAEISEFQQDDPADRKARLVDRLLSRPEYGQRWGRHWMDVWRYSDWDGYKQELRGSQRHIWHWRDWIIESLNTNKPYDQMVVEMLAGDEIAPGDPATLRATGFLARNFHKSNRDIWLDATVEHTGKAFLGLTLNCARCHDHKYDPIAQTDYYQFRAIFEPHHVRTEQLPGIADTNRDGIPRAVDAEPEAPTYLYVRGNEKQPLKDAPVEPGVLDWVPAEFAIEPQPLPLEAYYPALSETERHNRINVLQAAVTTARKALDKSLAALASPLQTDAADSLSGRETQLQSHRLLALRYETALAEQLSWLARYAAEQEKYAGSDAERRQLLARQAALAEHRHRRCAAELAQQEKLVALEQAQRSTEADAAKRKAAVTAAEQALKQATEKLAAVPTSVAADAEEYSPLGERLPPQSTGRRLALAKWIVDPANPLTARVAINQMWMRHLGAPLVESVFDFGMKSPPPELLPVLNWLAAELHSSGWDMKHIHRLIVLSDAYARSSQATQATAYSQTYDPDNRLFWRANVQRLDAEQVRDSLLAVAGSIDRSFSGPDIDYALGETTPRRSVYFRHAYEKQMTMLVLFDAASPNECYRRRPSVIPQQALVLMNSSLARNMARRLAQQLSPAISKPLNSPGEFVNRLFLATLCRQPTSEELTQCVAYLDEQTHWFENKDPAKTDAADEALDVPPSPLPGVRARESLALVMLNHNDFLSVR